MYNPLISAQTGIVGAEQKDIDDFKGTSRKMLVEECIEICQPDRPPHIAGTFMSHGCFANVSHHCPPLSSEGEESEH